MLWYKKRFPADYTAGILLGEFRGECKAHLDRYIHFSSILIMWNVWCSSPRNFECWWNSLSIEEQESVTYSVDLLARLGIELKFPHSSRISRSRYAHMRELRIQHQGRPYRVLYAFDPQRNAVLLIGGDKTGNEQWYETFVPLADRLYERHLIELEKSDNHGKSKKL